MPTEMRHKRILLGGRRKKYSSSLVAQNKSCSRGREKGEKKGFGTRGRTLFPRREGAPGKKRISRKEEGRGSGKENDLALYSIEQGYENSSLSKNDGGLILGKITTSLTRIGEKGGSERARTGGKEGFAGGSNVGQQLPGAR